MTVNESSVVKKHNNKWRVVDIVVAAIIAVAAGVIFWGWDVICAAPITLFEAVTPGFEGLVRWPPSSCESLALRCSLKPLPPLWSLPWAIRGASAVL